MIGGAPGRVIFELGIDKSLPKVRRLQNVHIAVQHFESVLRHKSSALQRSLCVWVGEDVYRCLVGVYSGSTDLHLRSLFLEQKSDSIGCLVPPPAVDGFNETLLGDICQRQRNV